MVVDVVDQLAAQESAQAPQDAVQQASCADGTAADKRHNKTNDVKTTIRQSTAYRAPIFPHHTQSSLRRRTTNKNVIVVVLFTALEDEKNNCGNISGEYEDEVMSFCSTPTEDETHVHCLSKGFMLHARTYAHTGHHAAFMREDRSCVRRLSRLSTRRVSTSKSKAKGDTGRKATAGSSRRFLTIDQGKSPSPRACRAGRARA